MEQFGAELRDQTAQCSRSPFELSDLTAATTDCHRNDLNPAIVRPLSEVYGTVGAEPAVGNCRGKRYSQTRQGAELGSIRRIGVEVRHHDRAHAATAPACD
jgi:hypothetical protein